MDWYRQFCALTAFPPSGLDNERLVIPQIPRGSVLERAMSIQRSLLALMTALLLLLITACDEQKDAANALPNSADSAVSELASPPPLPAAETNLSSEAELEAPIALPEESMSRQPVVQLTRELVLGEARYTVTLPEGLELELLNDRLQRPRLLSFGAEGELFIGSKSGAVYRLLPPYRHAETLVQLSGYPHSVAQRGDELFIARTNRLDRAPYRPGQRRIDPNTMKLVARLPGGSGHSSRTVAVGPDRRIYLGLGVTGNCSDEYIDESYPFQRRRGGVMVLDETATPARWRPFATGLRNPVGFDWHPETGVAYASNNGPDHLGYTEPREVFARLDPGSFHGMPWFQFIAGEVTRDRCIDSQPPRAASDVSLPVATFPARNAPMAVAFVPKGGLLPRYEGSAVVALRGSWGTQPSGNAWGDPASRRPPQLIVVRFEEGIATGQVEALLTGFQLPNGDRWARPVGVALGPDGALYFTSDSGINGLFRLGRAEPKAGS